MNIVTHKRRTKQRKIWKTPLFWMLFWLFTFFFWYFAVQFFFKRNIYICLKKSQIVPHQSQVRKLKKSIAIIICSLSTFSFFVEIHMKKISFRRMHFMIVSWWESEKCSFFIFKMTQDFEETNFAWSVERI